MVGLGRIAGCGADALVFLFDKLLIAKVLILIIAPKLAARAPVHIFGEGFGKPIG